MLLAGETDGFVASKLVDAVAGLALRRMRGAKSASAPRTLANHKGTWVERQGWQTR